MRFALDRGITTYEPSLLEGWTIGFDRLQQLTAKVAGSTEAERSHWPILGRGRSDIVVAGALVIRYLAERFHPQSMVCSTQGLRFGLARLAAVEAEAQESGPARTSGDGS